MVRVPYLRLLTSIVTSSFGINLALKLGNKIETVSKKMKATDNDLKLIVYLPCGGEIVLGFVEHFLAEDFARLLSDALTEVLIVDLDAGNVTLVAWNH